MTLTLMRPAIALAIALGLAGCGGKASFPINGSVAGLSYDGLVLNTNGMDLAVAKAATSFSFPNSLSYGDQYNVTVKTEPQHQTCLVQHGTDTAGRLASINVIVQCVLNQYTIGGTIKGLTGTGLVLTNGSAGGTVVGVPGTGGADVPFTFGNPVPFSVSYGVTVLTQPTGQTCRVSANGTGVMGDAAVADIVVTCE
jgi:hypothetical protein